MSEPTTTRKVRISFQVPDRSVEYGAPLSDKETRRQMEISEELDTAEVRFSGISDYSAKQVRALLPTLVAERKIESIEFIHNSRWTRSNGERGNMNGVILRGKRRNVELFVYGVSLRGSEPGDLATHIFDLLGVSNEDREVINRKSWPHIDYSVLIELL